MFYRVLLPSFLVTLFCSIVEKILFANKMNGETVEKEKQKKRKPVDKKNR
jgi:hypothetical protein